MTGPQVFQNCRSSLRNARRQNGGRKQARILRAAIESLASGRPDASDLRTPHINIFVSTRCEALRLCACVQNVCLCNSFFTGIKYKENKMNVYVLCKFYPAVGLEGPDGS